MDPNQDNNPNNQQQQQRRHLWIPNGPFAQHQQHLRQMWQREHRERQHWAQQVQAWRLRGDNVYEDMAEEQQQLQQQLDQNGQELPELRSRHNRHSSFVRFINKVSINISVYWIDYQGNKVFYKSLAQEDYLDINTFVTHPWIFIDDRTKMRYSANDQFVYFPEPWFAKYRNLQRIDLPARIERTNVFIRTPMRTLKELALWTIALRLAKDEDAYELELPRQLQRELFEMRTPKPDNQLP